MATPIDTEARDIVSRTDVVAKLQQRKAEIETNLATVIAQIKEQETEIDKSLQAIRNKLGGGRP